MFAGFPAAMVFVCSAELVVVAVVVGVPLAAGSVAGPAGEWVVSC